MPKSISDKMGLVSINEDTKECVFLSVFGKETRRIIPALNMDDVRKWVEGTLLQDALPYLTVEERELFITGLDQTDWDLIFND